MKRESHSFSNYMIVKGYSFKSGEQELVEDMIQIVTVFSARLNCKRDSKAKKLLKEFAKDD